MCYIFKSEDEDLKVAQMRKISSLIEKARINKEHEVLEIGCGWGTLAIEVVKRTGCKYTGITLSIKQLRFAEMRVKQAGLQETRWQWHLQHRNRRHHSCGGPWCDLKHHFGLLAWRYGEVMHGYGFGVGQSFSEPNWPLLLRQR